jgi:probable HAF family extracellular repeat protein
MIRMRRFIALSLVALVAVASYAHAAVSTYLLTKVDDPAADTASGERTRAFGINDAGYIVGDFGRHGFIEADGAFATVDVPGAFLTQAWGINNAGQIVGSFVDNTGTHAFLLTQGVFSAFDVPGAGTVNGAATRAHGINAAGQIVGDFDSSTGTHGFINDNGTFTILDFPNAYLTQAFGINDAGDIVGAISFAGVGGSSGFYYRDGRFVKLDKQPMAGYAGDPVTIAFGINSRGQIVGIFNNAGPSGLCLRQRGLHDYRRATGC